MRKPLPAEVDCAGCISSPRCWREEVPPANGFVVQRVKPLEAGEILFAEGARFEAPYVVTSGCLGVTELLPGGDERIVAFLVPGDVAGLESWNRETHRYGVQAVSAATLCRLRWSARPRSAALLRALLDKASLQLSAAAPWAGLPAAERVAGFVADFRRRTDQPMPMTRAQIGRHLGLAEETVVRALKSLGLREAARA
jgi:CRP/FNR family transcriptional regulator